MFSARAAPITRQPSGLKPTKMRRGLLDENKLAARIPVRPRTPAPGSRSGCGDDGVAFPELEVRRVHDGLARIRLVPREVEGGGSGHEEQNEADT
jgi:hypothetical protein